MAPDPKADQALKTCAISPQDNTHFTVRIDGIPLDPTKIDRATTNFYNVTLIPNYVKGIADLGPPGISRGIANAYILFLPPLPVGKHTIEFNVVDHLSGPTSEPIKRDGKYTVFIK